MTTTTKYLCIMQSFIEEKHILSLSEYKDHHQTHEKNCLKKPSIEPAFLLSNERD